MSDQQAELLTLTEQDVLHYLEQNPDLFARHPDVLSQLVLPHGQAGTVSLVERQAKVLREKNQIQAQQITALVSTAKRNELIYKAFTNLYMALLDCPDSKQLIYYLKAILLDQIELDAVKLTLFMTTSDEHTADLVQPRSHYQDVLDERLSRDTYYFGRLKQQELNLFFKPEQAIKSVCLVRLGEQQDLGILAFGSFDDTHFTPEMDTVFLDPMVKIINRLLFDFERG
jgi:uncharacterized protein YigA (DUF484 family)